MNEDQLPFLMRLKAQVDQVNEPVEVDEKTLEDMSAAARRASLVENPPPLPLPKSDQAPVAFAGEPKMGSPSQVTASPVRIHGTPSTSSSRWFSGPRLIRPPHSPAPIPVLTVSGAPGAKANS